MARPRTPLARARATGRTEINPGRFRDRSEPAVAPLGGPTAILPDDARDSWPIFTRSMSWLKESDRALVECAAILRARVIAHGSTADIAALRLCLSPMGGTPVDRNRVAMPIDDDADDPAAKYIN